MAESYDDIVARLNNPYGYAPMQPKAPASDFTQFVETLMEKPKGMFGMQDIIDERMRKSKEAEEAKARALAGGLGMFNQVSGGSGSDSKNVELTPEQIAFLDRETPDERYARITGDWFGLKPIAGMLLDPIGTFLTYPKQQPAPVVTASDVVARAQREAEARESLRIQAADILAKQAQEEQLSNKIRELTGVQPNGQYLSSYGTFTDSSSLSPETMSGLDAARSSYGYGSNADYYGD